MPLRGQASSGGSPSSEVGLFSCHGSERLWRAGSGAWLREHLIRSDLVFWRGPGRVLLHSFLDSVWSGVSGAVLPGSPCTLCSLLVVLTPLEAWPRSPGLPLLCLLLPPCADLTALLLDYGVGQPLA